MWETFLSFKIDVFSIVMSCDELENKCSWVGLVVSFASFEVVLGLVAELCGGLLGGLR